MSIVIIFVQTAFFVLLLLYFEQLISVNEDFCFIKGHCLTDIPYSRIQLRAWLWRLELQDCVSVLLVSTEYGYPAPEIWKPSYLGSTDLVVGSTWIFFAQRFRVRLDLFSDQFMWDCAVRLLNDFWVARCGDFGDTFSAYVRFRMRGRRVYLSVF